MNLKKKTSYTNTNFTFPEDIIQHIFTFIPSDNDRNSLSLVCKTWYNVDRYTRRSVFIGNCYATTPAIVYNRFKDIRVLRIKGKPHFADYDLVPDGWGGYLYTWVVEFVKMYPNLEELRVKRMVVSDECLEIIGRCFNKFKVLSLLSCDGFGCAGLSAIAANCRTLTELDLRDCEVDDVTGHWLSHFPDSFTSLESLDISSLSSEVSFSALERLVARSPNLRKLRLNRAAPLDKLSTLLRRAPKLVEFGTGTYSDGHAEIRPDLYSGLAEAFSGCKELKDLSGFWDAGPLYIPAIYSVCPRLTSLNLSYAHTLQSPDITNIISQCHNLQRLLVLDHIEDTGLNALALSCKDLQELRVFPSDPNALVANVSLTEKGLVSVSEGCPKLQSVLYFCRQMSNSALFTIAKNRPNLTCFRLCIIEPQVPDYLTCEPLDAGFGAIVENCKKLQRLSLSGFLTDRVFEYIGTHAKRLKMLSIAFAGDSDLGLHHILSGCDSLHKLEIRDCPFGDKALLANVAKLETMRSLWMSSCSLSVGACKLLSQKMPRLNVEVIDEGADLDPRQDSCKVEKLYLYRTVAGSRSDMPSFIWTIDQDPVAYRLKNHPNGL